MKFRCNKKALQTHSPTRFLPRMNRKRRAEICCRWKWNEIWFVDAKSVSEASFFCFVVAWDGGPGTMICMYVRRIERIRNYVERGWWMWSELDRRLNGVENSTKAHGTDRLLLAKWTSTRSQQTRNKICRPDKPFSFLCVMIHSPINWQENARSHVLIDSIVRYLYNAFNLLACLLGYPCFMFYFSIYPSSIFFFFIWCIFFQIF